MSHPRPSGETFVFFSCLRDARGGCVNTACERFLHGRVERSARGADEDLRCERDAVRLDEDLHEHVRYREGHAIYLPAQNPPRSPGLVDASPRRHSLRSICQYIWRRPPSMMQKTGAC